MPDWLTKSAHSVRRSSGVVPLWIVFCSFCSSAGWILSAVRQLNAFGYAIAFAIGITVLVWWWKRQSAYYRLPTWSRLRTRFGRLVPGIFLVLTLIALLQGILYPPAVYDALAYRIPRVLHW